jgi:PKD repeat protein
MRAKSHARRNWLLVGFIALALFMAGCSGPGAANEKSENKAPEAKLTTSKNIGWSGEGFVVDGSESKDPDGNITEYRFDFGDDTEATVVSREDDAARVNHSYLRGGEYTITLTVFDNGKETTGQKSSQATKTVAINERFPVAQTALNAQNVGGQTQGNSSLNIPVNEDADRFEASIKVRNTLASGASEVEIKFLDSKGDVLDTETVTVSGAGQEQTVELDGVIKDAGTHKLEMKAKSGAVLANGDLEVYYDKGYTN